MRQKIINCPMCGAYLTYVYSYFSVMIRYECKRCYKYAHEYSNDNDLKFQKFVFPEYSIFYSPDEEPTYEVSFRKNGLNIKLSNSSLDFNPENPKEPEQLLKYIIFS